METKKETIQIPKIESLFPEVVETLDRWIGAQTENFTDSQILEINETAQIIHQKIYHDLVDENPRLYKWVITMNVIAILKSIQCALEDETVVDDGDGAPWDSPSTVH